MEFLVELPGSVTLSGLPSPGLFNPMVRWLDDHRNWLWILAAVLAAIAVSIAGWKIGGIRAAGDTEPEKAQVVKPFQVDEAVSVLSPGD